MFPFLKSRCCFVCCSLDAVFLVVGWVELHFLVKGWMMIIFSLKGER